MDHQWQVTDREAMETFYAEYRGHDYGEDQIMKCPDCGSVLLQEANYRKGSCCYSYFATPSTTKAEEQANTDELIDGAIETLSAYIDGHSTDDALVQVINELTASQEARQGRS